MITKPTNIAYNCLVVAGVRITWDEGANPSQFYEIWRSLSGGAYTKAGVVMAGIRQFDDLRDLGGLTALNLKYKIKGVNHIKLSEYATYDPTFIMEVVTTSPNQSITIPHLESGSSYHYSPALVYNYLVTYGDNSGLKTVTSYSDADCTHVYANTGTYQIKIYGVCDAIYVGGGAFSPFVSRIISWGNVGLKVINFQGCINLTSIPSDPYAGLAEIRSFWRGFEDTAISIIPGGMFDHCDELIDLTQCFGSVTDTNGNMDISSIPIGLLDHCPKLTSVKGLFNSCKIPNIPTHLFDNNPLITDFSFVFKWNPITSLPKDIYKYNVLATTFREHTYGCTLESIDFEVFKYTPLVTDLTYAFGDNHFITSIPEGLFDNMPLLEDLSNVFIYNLALTSIPSGLFANNPALKKLYFSFAYCSHLQSIPSDLITNNPLVDDLRGTFNNCGQLSGNTPPIWTSHSGAAHDDCFINDIGLSNYAAIPNGWKGL